MAQNKRFLISLTCQLWSKSAVAPFFEQTPKPVRKPPRHLLNDSEWGLFFSSMTSPLIKILSHFLVCLGLFCVYGSLFQSQTNNCWFSEESRHNLIWQLLVLKLSKPQLNHNSTQPNITLSWVRHENDFAHHPTPPTPHPPTQTQCQQYLSCY